MISDVEEVREDGHVIVEGMDFEAIRQRGWPPCRVMQVRWRHQGRPITLASDFGVLMRLVPSRRFVAALMAQDAAADPIDALCIDDEEGRERHRVAAVQPVRTGTEAGRFRWFENVVLDDPNVFRVVFEVTRNGAMFERDFDAASGSLVGSRQTA